MFQKLKEYFFFKKRRVCKRDFVLCLDFSFIVIVFRVDVVFIRDVVTFQFFFKESILVVNGLRIEMENDLEQIRKEVEYKNFIYFFGDFIFRRKILENFRYWGFEVFFR